MKHKLFIIIFMVSFCMNSFCAEDTVRFINNKYHAHFKGFYYEGKTDSVYRGLLIDSMLVKKYGFFTKDLSRQLYISFFSNCIEFGDINGKANFITYRHDDLYVQIDQAKTDRIKEVLNVDDNQAFTGCIYSSDKNRWFWGECMGDEEYGLYKKDGRIVVAEDFSDEWFMKYFPYGIILFIFWIILVRDIFQMCHIKDNHTLLLIVLAFLCTILLYLVIPQDVFYFQFTLPLVIFILLHLIEIKPKLKIVRKALIVLSYIVVIFFIIYDNFCLKERIIIANEVVDVNWKAGTGILKRAVIRNELTRLNPVHISDETGGDYTSFVGPELLNESVVEAVIGNLAWWIGYPFLDRKPDLTYRECVYFLQKLKDITSLDGFDILRYSELKQLIEKGDIRVDNEHIEFTSSYWKRDQAIDEKRVIPCYDHVLCIDSSYSTKIRQAYKYSVLFNSSFRLAYRSDASYRNSFYVSGVKMDVSNTSSSDSIFLQKINNVPIERFCYEEFEENEIESYYSDRIIEYTTTLTGSSKRLRQKVAYSDYWFFPVFKYW